MIRRLLFLINIILISIPQNANAVGAKIPINVSFHIEDPDGVPNNNNFVKAIGAEQIYFVKDPIIGSTDIQWYFEFLSADEETYGVSFKLKPTAASKLANISRRFNKYYILPVSMNKKTGRKEFPELLIDKPVQHGIITIWSGIEKSELRYLKRYLKKYKPPKKSLFRRKER